MFGKKNGAPAPAREDAARARPKSKMKGGFRERLFESWVEIRENPGRSTLQALGVVLGVASVLGGFSISDSQRRQAERMREIVSGGGRIDHVQVYTVARAPSDPRCGPLDPARLEAIAERAREAGAAATVYG